MSKIKSFEYPIIVAENITAADYNPELDYRHSQVGIVMDVPGFSHLQPEAYTYTVGKYVFTLRKAIFFATNATKLEKALRESLKKSHLYNGGINWLTATK